MELAEIGEIVKPQGVKGEIKIRHFCDSTEVAAGFRTVYIRQKGVQTPFDVLKAREDKGSVYMTLEGIDDRDKAETLRGFILYADQRAFPKLPDNSFYIRDLIGLAVVTEQGEHLGKIIDVLQNGAVDVYCVKGEKTFMFPALKRVILKTDITAGEMVLESGALLEVAVYED
jgi:16S rRNA processing protein RimM